MNNAPYRDITQAQLLSQYNASDNVLQFNPELFERKDELIIEELKKVILSCERDHTFTLKVKSFNVIEDYNQIQDIMYNITEAARTGKNKRKINPYEFINLRDSDIKLLIVEYYIKVREEEKIVYSYICVPRIVDRYYFRISGNYYSAMYQIVDASTYNSETSKSKSDSVVLKTVFMPVRLYRYIRELETTQGEIVRATHFTATIFNKSIAAFKYILAKFGLYGTFKFLGINTIQITKCDPLDDEMYTFEIHQIYISIPKYIFDADAVTQSLVCSIYLSITKTTRFESVFTQKYWLESLGGEFSQYNVDKGLALLNSLEGIYDISTKESLHLPEEDKATIFHIVKWMITEFPALKNKDNLDISTKTVRYAPYIASLYAMKWASVIHKLSDVGAKIKMDYIETMIRSVKPSYLMDAMSKCKLINYKNIVNDLDSISMLKYTFKGISGIGEKSNATVPQIYRYVHPSHLGRLDLDGSSKSDPGLSSVLTPYVKLINNSFTDYQESNEWETGFVELMNDYKKLTGLKEALVARESLLEQSVSTKIQSVQCDINMIKALIKPVYETESTTVYSNELPLEGSGILVYKRGE